MQKQKGHNNVLNRRSLHYSLSLEILQQGAVEEVQEYD